MLDHDDECLNILLQGAEDEKDDGLKKIGSEIKSFGMLYQF